MTAKPKMPAEMWMPLVLMILGFYTLFALLTILKARTIILQRERRTQWVRELVQAHTNSVEKQKWPLIRGLILSQWVIMVCMSGHAMD